MIAWPRQQLGPGGSDRSAAGLSQEEPRVRWVRFPRAEATLTSVPSIRCPNSDWARIEACEERKHPPREGRQEESQGKSKPERRRREREHFFPPPPSANRGVSGGRRGKK